MSASKRVAAAVNDNSTNQPSSQTFTIPATAVVGDLVLFPVGQNSGTAVFSGPPGWTALAPAITTATNMTSQVWGKKLVAGEPGTAVTFTTSVGGRMVADYVVIQDSDLISEIVIATATGTTANPFTTPPVTTVETDCYIAEVAFARSALATQVTLSSPAGTVEDAQCNTNFATSPNFALGLYHRSPNAPTPGTYGNVNITANQAITGSHSYTIAVTSASAPPPVTQDIGMRVRVVMEDGTVSTLNVYAVLADGTLRQVSGS